MGFHVFVSPFSYAWLDCALMVTSGKKMAADLNALNRDHAELITRIQRVLVFSFRGGIVIIGKKTGNLLKQLPECTVCLKVVILRISLKADCRIRKGGNSPNFHWH